MDTTFLEALRKELPPTFSRQVAAEALKGIYSAGRLCTLDSMGKGPGGVRLAGFDGIAGNVQAQEELDELISSGNHFSIKGKSSFVKVLILILSCTISINFPP